MSDSNTTIATSGCHVDKRFGSGGHLATVLGGVSLESQDNQFFTLPDPSGSGEKTPLRLIAGFEMPTEREFFTFDNEIEDLPSRKRLTAS